MGENHLGIAIGEPAEPTMGGDWAGLTRLHASGVQNLEESKMKQTLSLAARVSPRALAGTVRFLQDHGHYPKSRSEIVAMALLVLANQLASEELPTSDEQALAFLDREFPVKTREGFKIKLKSMPAALGSAPVGQPRSLTELRERTMTMVGGPSVEEALKRIPNEVSHDSGSQLSEQAQWEDLNSAARTGGAIPGAMPGEVRYE